MKRITVALALGLAVLLCGCATTGYKRATQTRSAIENARTLTVSLQQEVETAVQSLQKITAPDVTDLRPPYEEFSAAVKKLEHQVERLATRGRVVQRRSDAYFQAWKDELNSYRDSVIRSRSAERRNEVMQSFQRISRQFREADQSLRPLLVYLKDMRRYLGTDLTPAGVASAHGLTGSITNLAAEVQQRLKALLDELDRVAAETSPVRPGTHEPMDEQGNP